MDAPHPPDAPVSFILVLPDGAQCPIPTSGLTIGRLPDNDLVLDDPQVSRRHAEIHYRAGVMHVKDLASFNGTKVNGTRVTGEDPLADGDVLQLGETTLTFGLRQAQPVVRIPATPGPMSGPKTVAIPIPADLIAADAGSIPLTIAVSEQTPGPRGASAVIQLGGVLNIKTADLFRYETQRLLDAGAISFTIDCSEVEYFDSSGIGALVALYRAVQRLGGHVCLKDLRPAAKEIIELTRLDRIFVIQ